MYSYFQDYVYDESKFLSDIATAWNKLAIADRSSLPSHIISIHIIIGQILFRYDGPVGNLCEQ